MAVLFLIIKFLGGIGVVFLLWLIGGGALELFAHHDLLETGVVLVGTGVPLRLFIILEGMVLLA